MTTATNGKRLRNRQMRQNYLEPEVTKLLHTAKTIEKPARITKRQLGQALAVLQRMAAGGDATVAVDAAALVPMLQRACAAAPRGHRAARVAYTVTDASGVTHRAAGLAACAKLAGKAKSSIANAMSRAGNGVAEFPTVDEHGNPSVVRVVRVGKA